MKFVGLNQTEIYEFEQLRQKLRTARRAAVDVATAYDAALAEMRDFVENARLKSDNYSADRSDEWDKKYGHPPKKAKQKFSSDWHHAELNLIAIEFDAATKKHIELLENLRIKV